ncbi:GDSL-type esterase/lipase family protein [Paenibacillus sp. WLX2291]|uniref:GDSL-type esterase/lipase family protein n=1 Tax=Paenibacillus sp. WLX2291 TaxID=3296934 RepID=UPI003984008B
MVLLRVLGEGVEGLGARLLGLQEGDGVRWVWDGDAERFVSDGLVLDEDEPLGRLVVYSVGDDVARGCVVVLPGGGYHHRAEHEGAAVARWLNGLGIHAAVLHYRTASDTDHTGRSDDEAKVDPRLIVGQVEAALLAVRRHGVVDHWNVVPDRIGLIGFSAGGHLAALAATTGRVKPDVLLLAYPVITLEQGVTHEGSRQQLIGAFPSEQQIAQYSAEQRVDAHTPPTFIWSSADDAAVPVQNSLLFAQALAAAGIEHELHIFEHGRHGLGLAEQHPYCGTWTALAARWLEQHGYGHPFGSDSLFVDGVTATLSSAVPAHETLRLYIAGDSTAAIKGGIEKPMSGWGEFLGSHFQKRVQVENYAINGRSTRSFIDDGRLDYIAEHLQSGDYLFIQFGHNDGKIDDPTRYTDPDTEYPAFLQRYIETARNHGAIPVLLTSVSRRLFLEHGQPDPLALDRYPEMMRRVANDTDTPLLDIFTASQHLYEQLGVEDSKALLLHLPPGQHPNYPQGVEDNTHFSVYGAQRIAELVVAAIAEHPQLKRLAQLLT